MSRRQPAPGGEWAIVAITLVALAFRLLDLDRHSLWFDEALEVGRAAGNLSLTLRGRPIDQDPPLLALGLHLWLRIGRGEWWLRVPNALVGAATVFLAARWASWRFHARIGVFTGLLAACAPVLVHYSQELNQYAPLVLGSVVLLLGWDGVVRRNRRRDWGLAGAASALGLATHYGMAFPVAATACHLTAWTRRQDRATRRRLGIYLAVLGGTTLLLMALGLAERLGVWHLQRRFGGTHLAKEIGYLSDILWREVLVFFLLPFSGGPSLWAVRVLAAIGLLGACHLWRCGPSGRGLIGVSFLLSLAMVYPFDGLGLYPIGHRYVLFAAPPFFLALAAGLDRLTTFHRRLGLALAASSIALFVAFSPQGRWPNPWLAVPREEMRPVVAAMTAARQTDELLYVYYAAQPAFAYYVPQTPPGTMLGTAIADESSAAAEARRIALAANDRPAWLLLAHEGAGDRQRLLTALRHQGYRTDTALEAQGAAAIRIVARPDGARKPTPPSR